MKNEHEIENLIEEKSKELKRIDVPSDLWFSIEKEINKIPSKRTNIFAQIYALFWSNKLNLGYAIIVCFIISISYFIYNIKKENPIAQNKSVKGILLQKSDIIAPAIKSAAKNENTRVIKVKLSKEKRINSLEKRVAKKMETSDPYTQSVYQNKIADIDESINECKKIFSSDYNQIIKRNLAMVYDEKIKLLLDILKLN